MEHNIKHYSQGTVDAAYRFAKIAHGDQKRKYTGEPYIVHPVAVARQVASVTDGIDMIAAALCHDVLEDTDATVEEMEAYGLGFGIAWLVTELTDTFVLPEHGNRALRKTKERERLSKVSDDAKTIKLADVIDNSVSIIKYDENFAKVYMREMADLLEVLEGGNAELFKIVQDIIMDYYLRRKI